MPDKFLQSSEFYSEAVLESLETAQRAFTLGDAETGDSCVAIAQVLATMAQVAVTQEVANG